MADKNIDIHVKATDDSASRVIENTGKKIDEAGQKFDEAGKKRDEALEKLSKAYAYCISLRLVYRRHSFAGTKYLTGDVL